MKPYVFSAVLTIFLHLTIHIMAECKQTKCIYFKMQAMEISHLYQSKSHKYNFNGIIPRICPGLFIRFSVYQIMICIICSCLRSLEYASKSLVHHWHWILMWGYYRKGMCAQFWTMLELFEKSKSFQKVPCFLD